MSPRFRKRRLLAPAAFAAALAFAAPAAAHDVSTIATGLNGPRGLDLGPDGALYVAEAGTAGDTCSGEGPARLCVGPTGSVSRVERDGSGQQRVRSGLPSLNFQGEFVGPQDVAFRGRRTGYVLVGLGADPARRADFGSLGPALGQLYRWRPGSAPRPFADIAAFEGANDPDEQGADSNPWSVEPAGEDVKVTDAGGNSVVSVDRHSGEVSLAGVLPPQIVPNPTGQGPPEIPAQAVPTGIAATPDRQGYAVGQLTGFPFAEGTARVFGFDDDEDLSPFATGFTHIVDVAYASDGTLYVLQLSRRSLLAGDPVGALYAVRPNGTRYELAPGRLTSPTGLHVTRSYAYVSNQGLTPSGGEILKISRSGWR